jgi:SPP1 gp7 family putative phage head morphogenesis protein
MLTGTARRPDVAQAVYQQLREDFPQKSCSWVLDKNVTWLPVRRVPLGRIDYSNSASWDAATHRGKIGHFRDKITAGDDKPLILVMRPGKKTAMVADGHHRALAAREEHLPPLAYMCVVPSVSGPWDAMHDAQRGSRGQVKLASETVPAPVQPPPPGQQAPPQQQAQADDQLALAVAAALAVAVTPEALAAYVGARFTAQGMRLEALRVSAWVVMAMPHEQQGMIGPATRNVITMNRLRRAQFLVASTRRVTRDIVHGVSHDESLLETLRDAAARERRYYAQHMAATWNRMDAAARVDSAAMMAGTVLLGWNTVLDARTSAECKAANGRNFRADIMPSIGYPGMVHPHCRCYPGRARPGARLLTLRLVGGTVGRCPVSQRRVRGELAPAALAVVGLA